MGLNLRRQPMLGRTCRSTRGGSSARDRDHTHTAHRQRHDFQTNLAKPSRLIHLPPLDRPLFPRHPKSSTATSRYPQPATGSPPRGGDRFDFSPLQPCASTPLFSDDGPTHPCRLGALQDHRSKCTKYTTLRSTWPEHTVVQTRGPKPLHQIPVPRVGQAKQSLHMHMTQVSRAPESWNSSR